MEMAGQTFSALELFLRMGQRLRGCIPVCHPSQRILSERAILISKTSFFNYSSHNLIAGLDGNIGLLCVRYAGGVEQDLAERRLWQTPALRICVEIGDHHGIRR